LVELGEFRAYAYGFTKETFFENENLVFNCRSGFYWRLNITRLVDNQDPKPILRF